MANKPFKHRLMGYKIAVLLLYGKGYPFLERSEGQQISIRTGPFARYLHITTSRLKEQLRWLEQLGILTQLSMGSRKSSAKLVYPEDLHNEP